jgi:hypothetical protein
MSALAEARICNGTEEELKKALRYIFVLVGLKSQNYPVAEEKQLLHEFIFENYGGHTPAEIKLAFKLAITLKLGLKPENVVCYENFSIAYFSRIMEAYRDWAREQVKLLPEPELKPKVLTEQEKLQIDFDYACYLLKLVNLPPSTSERVRAFNHINRMELAFYLLSQINKLPCRV